MPGARRSPPEPVKRVLAACWLLLHCQRFKDKPSSAVRFDEVRLDLECANTLSGTWKNEQVLQHL